MQTVAKSYFHLSIAQGGGKLSSKMFSLPWVVFCKARKHLSFSLFLSFLIVVFVFRWSSYVAEAGLELMVLLPRPPNC
jgi:hypothetical protein